MEPTNPARRLGSVLKQTQNGRVVNSLASVALVTALLRTALSDTSQLFARGAAIGELVDDLAIAYLAAWIFNLLVVEMPRQRDAAYTRRFSGPLLRQMAAPARVIASAMLTAAGTPMTSDDAPIGRGDLMSAAKKLRPGGAAPLVMRQSDQSLADVTWLDFMGIWGGKQEERTAAVLPLLHLFDPSLVEAIVAYNEMPFWGIAAFQYGSHFGSTVDLTMWASQLANALEAADRITGLLNAQG